MEKLKSESNKNVLFLNAGDYFQGSIWYTFFKHSVISDFVPKMGLDAMSLGNHEFDDGVDGLFPFINAADDENLPVLACNVDISEEPKLINLRKSIIVERYGRRIAIIGYVTPETATLAKRAPSIEFLDEIESIKKEIEIIKNKNVDINIFIALGHSGYSRDKEIAVAIPDIDIIVGGHTNTFLYTGDNVPSNDKAVGPYPTVIEHSNGRQTLIVQAYAYGKYLGLLDVTFDVNGNVLSFSGNPIYINSSIPQSTKHDIKSIVDRYKLSIDGKFNEIIGASHVDLEGHCVKCRTGECSMGNMITDSYVDGFVKISRSTYDQGWTKYPIAITSSGDIRCSKRGFSDMNITLLDILSIIPFGNTIEVVTMSGKRLKQVLEHSVSTYDPKHERLDGRFLQVSGIHVKYDISRRAGDRVVKLKARCGRGCMSPTYEDVVYDDNVTYSVIATNYFIGGGDGYDMVTQPDVKHEPFGTLDYDLVSEYIKLKSPLTIGNEERIQFVQNSKSSGSIIVIYYISLLIPTTLTYLIASSLFN